MELNEQPATVADAVDDIKGRFADLARKRHAEFRNLYVRIAIAFAILTVAFALALRQGQREHDLRVRANEQRARDNCAALHKAWDGSRAIVEVLTQPTPVSPAVLKLFPTTSTGALLAQLNASNANKVRQARAIYDHLGPEPTC